MRCVSSLRRVVGALFLAVERFARNDELLQRAAARQFGVAQRRQRMSGDCLRSRGFALSPGALLTSPATRSSCDSASASARAVPAVIDERAQRLGAADAAGRSR